MSSANREPPHRRTPPAGKATAARGSGPATIRALPPPPQVASGKGTPPELGAAPAHTIVGYTEPIEPGPVVLAEDLLPAGSQVGDYEILEVIGAGGMGTVYAARYPMIQRKVAIKVIASQLCRDPGVVQQFVIEARAANQIANRHVVDIHTLGTLPDGRPYLVMELLRGQTLTQRLRYGKMDIEEAVAILDQIAEAMEAAHKVPIVHRDLKPDNVFLEDNSDGPEVKILDFGIAKLAGEAQPSGDAPGDEAARMRTTGGLVGTPHYMAPEQARAQLVGTPADLYAFGLIAFEMLAGRPPFEAESAAEILVAHLQTPPPQLKAHRPDVPEGLDEHVQRLHSKDPSDRPTATEVRASLRALYAHRSYPRVVPPIDLPLREHARLWLQRPRNRLLLAAQVAIGALMLAAYLFIGDDEPARPHAPASAPAATAAPSRAPSATPAATAAPSSAPSATPAGSAASATAPSATPAGFAATPAAPAAPASPSTASAAQAPAPGSTATPAPPVTPATGDAPTSAPVAAPAPGGMRPGDAPVTQPFGEPTAPAPSGDAAGARAGDPAQPASDPSAPADRDAPIRDPFAP
jgi:serine/threonine protein kinase